jgi:hypothetical protein
MSSRDLARQLIIDISSYDLEAQFEVVAGYKLVITGKLTPELTEQIKQHKSELIGYLTTPPDVIGICRRGHKVTWQCTPYGLWVCGCYFQGPVVEQKIVKRLASSTRDYWHKERA